MILKASPICPPKWSRRAAGKNRGATGAVGSPNGPTTSKIVPLHPVLGLQTSEGTRSTHGISRGSTTKERAWQILNRPAEIGTVMAERKGKRQVAITTTGRWIGEVMGVNADRWIGVAPKMAH